MIQEILSSVKSSKQIILRRPKPPQVILLLTEGLTVGALILSRICLMGTYHDSLQRAVVSLLAVMCALGNSTFDAFVCMTIHDPFLLYLNSSIVSVENNESCRKSM